MNLGAPEIALIALAFLLLFGYERLPDASRSLARSMRVFTSEMQGMQADGRPSDVAGRPGPGGAAQADLDAAAAAAEAQAAVARQRADAARAAEVARRDQAGAGPAR